MKKGIKIFIVVLLVLIILAGIVFGYFWIKLKGMSDGAVDIVPQPTISATPLPEIDDSLEDVEGTPDDIHIDYDVTTDKSDRTSIYKKEPIDSDVINIVLIGQDSSFGSGSTRSDSTILMSYNKKTNTIKMVSFLRDMWVQIDGYGWNRINAAYSFGGPGLAINTLNDRFQLDIQRYVIIGFDEFENVIDEMGGIDIYISAEEAKYINKSSVKEKVKEVSGVQHLNGAQTLVHARNRRTGSGDFSRTDRQRQIILAIYSKLVEKKDAGTLMSFINYSLDNVKTNMSPNEITSLAVDIVGSGVSFESSRVPFDGEWKYAKKEGKSVLSIDLADNVEKLHDFLY